MYKDWLSFVSQDSWVHYLIEITLLLLAAWLVRAVVLRVLRRWAARTETKMDDRILDLVDHALTPILILALAAASLNLFPLSEKLLRVLNRMLYLGVLSAVLYYGARIAQFALAHWLDKSGAGESLREPARFLTRIMFAAFGIIILLDNLGVSLTAVWTTLGVGSVAVALALQDTLSNFFAGIYLRLDSPVRLGDFVKLDSGQEGFVVQMGWRSTRIRTLPNNVVVVPNAKLATAVITNYSLPEEQMSLLLSISVSYGSDPEHMERILVEEAVRAVGQVEGLLGDPAPFVRFIPGFGESSLDFTLICRVNTFVDQYLVQHELRKRILARFRKEKIEIPFPQRDVHLYSEAGRALQAAR